MNDYDAIKETVFHYYEGYRDKNRDLLEKAFAPLSEGKLIASRIPGAKLVTLNSKNHMIFEEEPGVSEVY